MKCLKPEYDSMEASSDQIGQATQCGTLEFATRWHLVQRKVLDAASVEFFHNHALTRAATGQMTLCDPQVPGSPSAYGDPLMDMLLEKLRPTVECATGLSLFPTYSYFRVYKRGDALKRHRDRSSCEVSMTLNLGYSAKEFWPIWVAGPAGTTSVVLQPGDGLIYRGCECDHWREAFDGDYLAQVFLHYVDQNGPYAEWKFDKRRSLSRLL